MILHVNYLPQARTAAAKDLLPALFALLEEGRVDPGLLANLRVHLDWVQYKSNSREPVTIRRAVTGRGEFLPLSEVAIDVRQANPESFRDELARAFDGVSAEPREVEGRVVLEPFGPY